MSWARVTPRMRVLLAALAMLVAFGAAASVASAAVDPTDIEDEVMCVQCGRVLSTSNGPAADDERGVITRAIEAGLTKEQIKQQLVAEYGKRVLLDKHSTVAALAPWLAALAGAASIALLLSRRRRRGAVDGGGAEAAAAGPAPDSSSVLSAEDDARLDAELAETD